ncbi:PAS domain-containing sensor histidine kinase [Natronomonas salina]|uniref:PAS domain S-box protein n=1 Tax=Natronomonas salina TaxID=1710540 RepID=UPI0015B3EA35|nr:PAS domain-containing sensor histidine kinase [Natronomonas salina]QLD88810.1 PAS domain-containing sensor histidine kinase [Natronomonas salina]
MGGTQVVRKGEPIREDEAFLNALVENTSEGLLTIDTDSEIIFANPALEEILGYEPEELIGSPKMKIIPERLRPVHQAGLKQYLESGEKHIDWTGVELPALHKDGDEVPVAVSLKEHEYNGERLFTGIITDITERKRQEEKLRRQKHELEEFADVLAHDLRNPLTVAEGYIDLARENNDWDDLDNVEDALGRMRQIIDDTLSRARNGEVNGSSKVMPFSDVMRMAWDSVPTPDATLVLPEPAWKIRAHESCLCQLVENLIRNAVEHAGTDVTVEIDVLESADGFYVQDDGPGYPEDVKIQMEAPSGLSRQYGDGYGLQIVRQVADEHGWEMHLRDAPDGGARIEFTGVKVYRR